MDNESMRTIESAKFTHKSLELTEGELKELKNELKYTKSQMHDLELSLNHLQTKADTWRAAFCVGALTVVAVGIYVAGKIL